MGPGHGGESSDAASRTRMERRLAVALVALGLSAYLAFAVASLDEPPMGDSVDFLVVADKEAGFADGPARREGGDTDGYWHPRAYMELLVATGRVFGKHWVARRAIGIPVFLLTLWLTWRLASVVRRDRDAGPLAPALAVFLLCTSPFAIKGSVHLDIDNSLLTAGCMALTYACVAGEQWPMPRRAALTGVVFGVALWAKLTTPLAVLAGVFAYEVALRRPKRAMVFVIAAGAIGFGLFLCTWCLYCASKGIDWRVPIRYTLGALAGQTSRAGTGADLMGHVRVVIRVLLWFSPFLAMLAVAGAAAAAWRLVVRPAGSARGLVACISLTIFCGYLVVGRVVYGLPKYEFPALPLFCVLAADLAVDWLGRGTGRPRCTIAILCIFALAFAIQVAWVGDLLYRTDYHLKDARAISEENFRQEARHAAVASAALGAAFLIVLAAAWWRLRDLRRSLALCALSFAVAGHLATDTLQCRAGYTTIYDYGVSGVEETASYVDARVPPDGRILATREILYLSRNRVSPSPLDALWSSSDQVAAVLADPTTGALVLSIGGHTRAQRDAILGSSACRGPLDRDYEFRRIGSYLIWTRKR